ncbi:response regulator [Pedobacter antarcticus]|uniref:Transcriptional regulator n=2 Tax=Pedobacter antarcticus TaxID=34086 RepID=A0A081PJB0_9SPHI|nr:response regulator [Pedobacter antarcticus]KEQ30783.1 transcriptional regulator [Pedobacter antarcticus 4BY]SDM42103.1 cAMP-binding domain of CRP or a regulatory subunit of cAMP-dependent protein kinases [Pedobacter antarcticus]SFE92549.1 cAMP-binding domain of CRP or a regulatory subunit of cAMP-dependent protein kinases [Pedobacter antarcticus]
MKKQQILIIEDNDDIRESTAEILELAGYEVYEANNGRSGVELAGKHLPDLILCDIMMPELDGYGVLYLLNKNPETSATPFIFLTAKAERTDMRKGMEMGADDYLIKPFDDVELLNAIESRLDKKAKQESFYSQSIARLNSLVAGSPGVRQLDQLIQERKVRHIKKKQIIYYEGDTVSGIYLVISGRVKTIKLSADGRELLTGMYVADEYFGIPSLLLNEPYTETAEAVEDSSVCQLPREVLEELLNKYPDVGRQFIHILSNNLIEKEEQLLQLAYHSVRKRMAEVLIRLCKQEKQQDKFLLKISRDNLAAMAGMATETVSRILSDFKDEGIIERKGSQIGILDLIRLQQMKN